MKSARNALAAATLVGACCLATSASAGELEVTLRAPGGAPVPNAVVTVYPSQGGHAPSPAALTMEQKDIAFSPFVLVAPLGSTVSFPNRDTVRHHVYSFSPAHRFELKLYGRQEARSERFDKPGVVALGCNIHDRMAGFIDVVDTRFAARSDAEGRVRITGLPSGPAEIRVWHPFSKAPSGQIVQTLTIGPDITRQEAMLDLRSAPAGKQSR